VKRQKPRALAATLTIASVFCLAMASGQQAVAKSRYISIGTGGASGVYFAAGNAICRLVHKEAAEARKRTRKRGNRCAAPATPGSVHNIAQVMTHNYDFGLAQSDWQFHAANGRNLWSGRKQSKLRAVFSVHPEPLQIIVSSKSGIKSWEDLKGKRVNIGNPGSGQRGTMDFLMKKDGMTLKSFSQFSELSSTEQSRSLCKGEIDAYVYTVGVPNAGVSSVARKCGAKIVNFNNAFAKSLVTKENPYFSWATIPKGTYKTTDTNVITFGVMATVVTNSDVSADVVYEVVRAVMENIEYFRSLNPAFAHLKPKDMIKNGLSAPLHAGAVRYYKERGWM
jgi:uncharacterized protein